MVVMDLGEYERGEKKIDTGSNHNSCIVSVVGSTILAKSGLKS